MTFEDAIFASEQGGYNTFHKQYPGIIRSVSKGLDSNYYFGNICGKYLMFSCLDELKKYIEPYVGLGIFDDNNWELC